MKNQKKITIPVIALKLADRGQFLQTFYECYHDFNSDREVYEYLESIREKYFNSPCFPGYLAFTAYKNRTITNKPK